MQSRIFQWPVKKKMCLLTYNDGLLNYDLFSNVLKFDQNLKKQSKWILHFLDCFWFLENALSCLLSYT